MKFGVVVGRFQVAYLHQGHRVLLKDEIGYRTVPRTSGVLEPFDQLETVFLNGELTRFQNLEEIRDRAKL